MKEYSLTFDHKDRTLRQSYIEDHLDVRNEYNDYVSERLRWVRHNRGSIPLDVFALEASKDQMRLIDNHVFERLTSWKLRQDEAGVDLDIKLGDVR